MTPEMMQNIQKLVFEFTNDAYLSNRASDHFKPIIQQLKGIFRTVYHKPLSKQDEYYAPQSIIVYCTRAAPGSAAQVRERCLWPDPSSTSISVCPSIYLYTFLCAYMCSLSSQGTSSSLGGNGAE